MEILIRILLKLSPPAKWGEQEKEKRGIRLALYKAVYKLYLRAQKRLSVRVKNDGNM